MFVCVKYHTKCSSKFELQMWFDKKKKRFSLTTWNILIPLGFFFLYLMRHGSKDFIQAKLEDTNSIKKWNVYILFLQIRIKKFMENEGVLLSRRCQKSRKIINNIINDWPIGDALISMRYTNVNVFLFFTLFQCLQTSPCMSV